MSELVMTPAGHVSCPSCQALIGYYDQARSAHFACPECHLVFSKSADGTTARIKKLKKIPLPPLSLPLGSTGTMPDGLPYRVTGYMLRKESNSPAQWREFMLFNPTTGYAQLAEYEGHWIFIRPTDQKYATKQGRAGSTRQIEAGGIEYAIYNKYQPRILYAEGEFEWNIFEDERLTITEFIAPPLMLVEEKAPSVPVQWFVAEHMEPNAVAAAFGLPSSQLPSRHGVGALQPPPGGPSMQPLRQFTLLLLGLVFLTHMFLINWRTEQQLLDQDFHAGRNPASPYATAADNTAKVLVSESFDVQEGPTFVYFELRANLDNSWLELPVSMVNEQTGRGFEFTKNIEYYHGTEGGESWTEGSVEAVASLAQVPAGRYHLNMYPLSEKNQFVPFHLTVTANAWLTSNYVLFSLLLLVYPAFLWWRRISHESSRWEQSNFERPI